MGSASSSQIKSTSASMGPMGIHTFGITFVKQRKAFCRLTAGGGIMVQAGMLVQGYTTLHLVEEKKLNFQRYMKIFKNSFFSFRKNKFKN